MFLYRHGLSLTTGLRRLSGKSNWYFNVDMPPVLILRPTPGSWSAVGTWAASPTYPPPYHWRQWCRKCLVFKSTQLMVFHANRMTPLLSFGPLSSEQSGMESATAHEISHEGWEKQQKHHSRYCTWHNKAKGVGTLGSRPHSPLWHCLLYSSSARGEISWPWISIFSTITDSVTMQICIINVGIFLKNIVWL